MSAEPGESHFPAGGISQCYELLGVPMAVTAPVPIAVAVKRLLSTFAVDRSGVPLTRHFFVVAQESAYELRDDSNLLLGSGPATSVVDALVSELNRSAIEHFSGFAVHAGVVAGGGNGAIAIPGASGHGKSTIVAALLAAGLEYVSDEVLGVQFGSRAVVPYAKPLRLSPESQRIVGIEAASGAVEQRLLTAADLGARVAARPLQLQHVVQCLRRRGPARLVASSSTEALTTLLTFAFNHYKDRERCFSLAVDLARHCQSWRMEYDHAPAAAALLAERLSADSPAA